MAATPACSYPAAIAAALDCNFIFGLDGERRLCSATIPKGVFLIPSAKEMVWFSYSGMACSCAIETSAFFKATSLR